MISIVSAYYNRKKLFYQTLKSITKSQYKDIEYVVVDDGSSSNERLEDLVQEFLFLKIKRVEKNSKWYINPCVPFNMAIREAKGDIIVLQNPECLHVHDVLTYITQNVNDSNYISISAYGLNPEMTQKLPIFCETNSVNNLLQTLPQVTYIGGDNLGWYNHSQFRPVYFHFCSAMTRNSMHKLNGFDERYAHGVGYDDDEIIYRIKMLGLQLIIADEVSVMHQHHQSLWIAPNTGELCERNRLILHNLTISENKYRANVIDLWNGI